MDLLSTSVRDKLILVILGILGLGCMIGLCFGVQVLKEPFVTIVGALAMGYKGNPSDKPSA